MDVLILLLLVVAAMLIWLYHPERAPEVSSDSWTATTELSQEKRHFHPRADRTISITVE